MIRWARGVHRVALVRACIICLPPIRALIVLAMVRRRRVRIRRPLALAVRTLRETLRVRRVCKVLRVAVVRLVLGVLHVAVVDGDREDGRKGSHLLLVELLDVAGDDEVCICGKFKVSTLVS